MIVMLAQVAAFVVALGVFITALGLLAQSKYVGAPLRWLWRRNVSGPVGDWNRGIIRDVVDDRVKYLMTHRNGGSSLLDLSESLKAVRSDVNTLLDHDEERDVEGMRYGPDDNEGGNE